MHYLSLMRPKDWIKNAFVLIPVLFWVNSPENLGLTAASEVAFDTLVTLLGFCILASGVYAINDALDAARDRMHPVKRTRPVASGAISPRNAILFGMVLLLASFGCSLAVGPNVFLVFLLYLLLQAFYNLLAKRLVLVDAVTIALGFVLRAAAGAFAIDIQLSVWLVLCVFFLCLYLAFVKRLCDYSSSRAAQDSGWRSPAGYDDPLELNWLLGVSGVMSLMMYLSYSLSVHAFTVFGPRAIGFALLSPLVLIVIHRFYRLANEGRSDSPFATITSDLTMQLGAVLFLVGIGLCLYVPAVEGVLSDLLIQFGPAGAAPAP
ncbi:MAG: UbiA prenyltransferase family protein [Planctomycetota bacterium]|nr:UbiA prenyltransferase family protein [Planctomycetota bacterium]MED5507400.1 UbiA prenyltransferase family protein [Planctomycetota bacterium]